MQLGWTPAPPRDPARDLTLVCNQTTLLISDNSTNDVDNDNDLASWACSSYLKDLLIQDSGTKDSDALGVDDSPIASPQWPGHLLLTVHDDGDALLIHAESDTMPSVQQRHNGKRDALSDYQNGFNHITTERLGTNLVPTCTECNTGYFFIFLP